MIALSARIYPFDVAVGDCTNRRWVFRSFRPTTEDVFAMSEIQVSGSFPSVPSQNLAAFKQLINEAVQISREKDPGTLQYEWFFNEDESACAIRERYASSEAMLAHMGNLGHVLGKLVEVGGGLQGVEVLGDPSPELLAAGAAFIPTVYKSFDSI